MQNRIPLVGILIVIVAALTGYTVYRRPNAGITSGPARVDATDPVDPAVQAVVDELIARWEEHDRVYVVIDTEIPNAAGKTGKTWGDIQYSYVKTDGAPLVRIWVFNNLSFEIEDGKRLETAEVLTTVHDGEFLWSTVQQHKLYTATKAYYDPDRLLQVGGSDLFRQLLTDNTLKLLPGESLDEKDMYVFSVTPKNGTWTSTYWFDKETGIQTKIIEMDESGEEQFMFKVLEVDLAPDFPDEKFTLPIHERYEFTDETKSVP